MVNECEVCGSVEVIPFRCKRCGGVFCGEHRLPEYHDCMARRDLARKIFLEQSSSESAHQTRERATVDSTPRLPNRLHKPRKSLSKGFKYQLSGFRYGVRRFFRRLLRSSYIIPLILIIIVASVASYTVYTDNGSSVDGFFKGLSDIVYPPVYTQSLKLDSNTYLANPDGTHACVTIYRNATDPTYDELMSFLWQDDTYLKTYVPGKFVCINFATSLSDNAERNGIKAHVVSIELSGYPYGGHACNAFNTTDRGWVFVDVTGNTAEQNAQGQPKSWGLVDMKVGYPYLIRPLTFTYGWTEEPLGRIISYQIVS
ncbi:AN1-type zinc finger domain-containing protein [Methanocella sp. MCL-LM]|uniref:AN1-type zinc finger domain-containing protein n=1 Tax=Methanocella sp. MCL-LM TaxID=3412035 RepID=UPI003C71BB82